MTSRLNGRCAPQVVFHLCPRILKPASSGLILNLCRIHHDRKLFFHRQDLAKARGFSPLLKSTCWRLFFSSAVLVTVAVCFFAGFVAAQPPTYTLRVETTSVQRLTLVVMPFTSDTASAWTTDLPQTLRDLVAADLAASGYFHLADPGPYSADTASLFFSLPNQPPRIIGSIEAGWSDMTANIGITVNIQILYS